MNNNVYLAKKVLLFIANYRRELRMGADISRKEKIEKMMKYVKRIKKVQEEVGVVLRKYKKR